VIVSSRCIGIERKETTDLSENLKFYYSFQIKGDTIADNCDFVSEPEFDLNIAKTQSRKNYESIK